MAIHGYKLLALNIFALTAFTVANANPTTVYKLEDTDLTKMEKFAHEQTTRCYPKDDGGAKAVKDLESIEDADNDTEADTLMYETLGDKPAVRSCLGEVAKVVLSHRDQNDGIVSKVLPKVMGQMSVQYQASIYKNIATEAIADLSATSTPLEERATAYEILKNIISELRPKASEKAYRSIFVDIQRAEITIPKDLDLHRRKTGFGYTPSPSKLASEAMVNI